MVLNIIIAILVFGVLVVFHEFGHFIAAKKCGVVVKEFSVGMGPRIFSVTKNNTKYSLKAVPFGGSCAMLGEDEDTVVEGSFNSKPVWKRMIIVFAGPFFNFILAFVAAIILIMLMGTGKAYVTGIGENTPAYEAGIRKNDHIISINGHSAQTLEQMQYSLFFHPIEEQRCEIKYERDGKVSTTFFDADFKEKYMMGFNYNGSGNDAAEIGKVNIDSPIRKAGAKAGDIITSINGTEINSGSELSDYIAKNPFDGSEVTLGIERKGKKEEIIVKPLVTRVYDIGFDATSDKNGDGKADAPDGIGSVIEYSYINVKTKVTIVFESLKLLITGEAQVSDMQGPVGIVAQMGETLEETPESTLMDKIGTILFWIVFLSTNLGVMNLLPLPALDGGRLFVNIIEVIIRKPINRTAEGIYHFVGFCLLMALMVFLVIKDVSSLI